MRGNFLLGIHCAQIKGRLTPIIERRESQATGEASYKPSEQFYVRPDTGMAVVIPAWKLSEILHSETLETQRKKEDEDRERRVSNSPIRLESA